MTSPQRPENDDVGERNAEVFEDQRKNSEESHQQVEDVPVGGEVLGQAQPQKLQAGFDSVHWKKGAVVLELKQ